MLNNIMNNKTCFDIFILLSVGSCAKNFYKRSKKSPARLKSNLQIFDPKRFNIETLKENTKYISILFCCKIKV